MHKARRSGACPPPSCLAASGGVKGSGGGVGVERSPRPVHGGAAGPPAPPAAVRRWPAGPAWQPPHGGSGELVAEGGGGRRWPGLGRRGEQRGPQRRAARRLRSGEASRAAGTVCWKIGFGGKEKMRSGQRNDKNAEQGLVLAIAGED